MKADQARLNAQNPDNRLIPNDQTVYITIRHNNCLILCAACHLTCHTLPVRKAAEQKIPHVHSQNGVGAKETIPYFPVVPSQCSDSHDTSCTDTFCSNFQHICLHSSRFNLTTMSPLAKELQFLKTAALYWPFATLWGLGKNYLKIIHYRPFVKKSYIHSGT
jgi:hypothetical protein